MNATPHTLAGVSTVVLFQDNLWIGIPLAIGTHFAMDYIGESKFTSKDRLYFDLLPSLICYLTAIYLGNFWLFLLGSIAGNLPDLIDKKLYLATFLPDKFKSTEFLHWQKPIVEPRRKANIYIGVFSGFFLYMLLTMIS